MPQLLLNSLLHVVWRQTSSPENFRGRVYQLEILSISGWIILSRFQRWKLFEKIENINFVWQPSFLKEFVSFGSNHHYCLHSHVVKIVIPLVLYIYIIVISTNSSKCLIWFKFKLNFIILINLLIEYIIFSYN